MDARSSASSPYQSLGDRPEMELDLWEGQFNLSSLAGAEDEDLGLGAGEGQEDLVEMYSRGATCWGEDSSVTMGTVHQMQESVGRLQEVSELEEHEVRYQSVKQDNNSLVKKIFVLEELIRDMEVTNIDLTKESERKTRELELKLDLERKKSEDYLLRIQELELDNATLSEKSEELHEKLSDMTLLKEEAECKLAEYEIENDHPSENFEGVKPRTETFEQTFSRLDKSETDSGCHIQDPEELVTELQSRMADMEKELRVSKDQYKCLLEQNKQAESISQYEANDKSLAQEIRETSQKDRENRHHIETEIENLKKSLTSQEEVNNNLQKYIDSVILNIMEKHPELLEVTQRK